MTYKETIEFLYSCLPVYHRIGKAAYKNNLDNTIAFDEYLNNPHRRFRSIHVAGTNGKGSVSHMLASLFHEAGYITGLYTSPHLRDYRERIKINGKMIPEEEVVGFVQKHLDFITRLHPSFFELSVAMAFDYFARMEIDIAIIETGLGGRLDSTNIVKPLMSVITNIGFDHTDLLGNTIAAIANEKAGIIKSNTPVIIGEKKPDSASVFVDRAGEMCAPITFSEDRALCSLEEYNVNDDCRSYIIKDLVAGTTVTGKCSLTGEYQAKNIPLVYTVFNALKESFNLAPDDFKNGLANVIINTGLLGRWQVLERKPLTICDTGHNRDGLMYVLDQLGRIRTGRLHIVIGFVSDKDLSLVLGLFPVDAHYYFTKASVPRALDEKLLQHEAESYGLKGNAYNDVRSALHAARAAAGKEDLIFIGGSTFVVAEVV